MIIFDKFDNKNIKKKTYRYPYIIDMLPVSPYAEKQSTINRHST